MTGPGLVGQFWGLDSDGILKFVLREIILSQEIQMPQAAADHSRLPGEGRHYAAGTGRNFTTSALKHRLLVG